MVCQKLNSDTELVVCYDCKDRLYYFNISDFQNFVVQLLPVTPADFIAKLIRQRFTNDQENENWWEQGIVISKDLSNYSDFTVNFFDKDHDESESSLNVYEVLALLLLDDYLNHGVQFLRILSKFHA